MNMDRTKSLAGNNLCRAFCCVCICLYEHYRTLWKCYRVWYMV